MKALYFALIFCSAAIFAYGQINTGLVAHYPLNGNANDVTSGGRNGTITGAVPAMDIHNRPDSAYHFDGNAKMDFFSDNDFLDTNDFTIALLFKPDTSMKMSLFSKRKTCNFESMVSARLLAGDSVQVSALDENSNYVRLVAKVNTKQWNYLVFRRKNDTIGLFLNNQKIGELSTANNFSVSNTAMFGLSNGPCIGFGDSGFIGDIDDVRIYNRYLSENEAQQLYTFVTTSIKEGQRPGLKFSVTPNPFDKVLQIHCANQDISTMEVYSITGQKLLSQHFNPELDLSTLSKGTYILTLLDKDGALLGKKIIIKN